MQQLNFKVLALVALTFTACSESNPYKDGQVGYASSSDQTSNTLQPQPEPHSEPSSDPDKIPADVEIAPPVAADVKTAPPEALNFGQIICDDKDFTAKFPLEMSKICVEGKPSADFVKAINAPYSGQGNPNLIVLQNADINRSSHFIIISSIEINKGQKEAFAVRELINNGTIRAVNAATLVQNQIASLTVSGLLARYEIAMDVAIPVGPIVVEDRRISMRDYATLKEGSIIKSASYLKAGVEDNEDKLANILSWWISEGNKTRIVGITHQQSPNRNRHEIAQRVVLGLARTTLVDSVAAFNK